MSTLTKLTSGGQVTLPKAIRQKINMLPGDFVDVQLDEEGRILLTPKKLVDASQAYYWTQEWQERERQARADIKAGRGKCLNSPDEVVKYFEELG